MKMSGSCGYVQMEIVVVFPAPFSPRRPELVSDGMQPLPKHSPFATIKVSLMPIWVDLLCFVNIEKDHLTYRVFFVKVAYYKWKLLRVTRSECTFRLSSTQSTSSATGGWDFHRHFQIAEAVVSNQSATASSVYQPSQWCFFLSPQVFKWVGKRVRCFDIPIHGELQPLNREITQR